MADIKDWMGLAKPDPEWEAVGHIVPPRRADLGGADRYVQRPSRGWEEHRT